MKRIITAGVTTGFVLLIAPSIITGNLAISRADNDSEKDAVYIGRESLTTDNPRCHYGRCINDAPADGETLSLNPPRFRWRYHPEGNRGGLFTFVFQIAREPDFATPVVDVITPFNFYNSLSPLVGNGPFYWRIGYIIGDRPDGKEPFYWSPHRAFTLAANAIIWDRSAFARPDFSAKPHPRIILNDENVTKILDLIKSDSITRAYVEKISRAADSALSKYWYDNIPASDIEVGPEEFQKMARGLCEIAFMYRLTGEEKYKSVKSRALTFASYPYGGRTTGEPIGEFRKRATLNTEYLALTYDWLYPDLSDEERRVFVKSLEWRIDHSINDFAWKHKKSPAMQSFYGDSPVVHTHGSLSVLPLSHSLEALWVTFPASLAIYEDSAIARECFHLAVNYLAGVGSTHGFDEGWNEGTAYMGSKLSHLLNGHICLTSVFPDFELGKNPWLKRMGEFLCYQAPSGLTGTPWGHNSNRK